MQAITRHPDLQRINLEEAVTSHILHIKQVKLIPVTASWIGSVLIPCFVSHVKFLEASNVSLLDRT